MAKTEKEYNLVRCYDCELAYLMQNGKNPIIAGCKVTHEREVAKVKRLCKHYKERKGQETIHEMYFAK